MYTILEASDVRQLEQLVRSHLEQGWKLAGGPFTYSWAPGHGPVATTPANHPQTDGWVWLTFCQAMTRWGQE